jgi:carboxymethylenebutenolidase
MCFSYDARPPLPPGDLLLAPVAGGAGAELLELSSEDGTRFSASFAQSPSERELGVVILPDVRGLYPFYIELAERFAQAGHSAIVLDYFGRTAGLGPRGEEFEFMPHVMELKVPQVHLDIAATVAALRERTGVEKVATVGFCLGGMQSFLAGTNADLGIDREVGFYAALDGSRFGISGPLDRAAEIRGPLLGLFGGADQVITQDQIDEFESRLASAGVEHEVHVYPGAPHSFFDRSYEQFADACEDAWRRVLSFLSADG